MQAVMSTSQIPLKKDYFAGSELGKLGDAKMGTKSAIVTPSYTKRKPPIEFDDAYVMINQATKSQYDKDLLNSQKEIRKNVEGLVLSESRHDCDKEDFEKLGFWSKDYFCYSVGLKCLISKDFYLYIAREKCIKVLEALRSDIKILKLQIREIENELEKNAFRLHNAVTELQTQYAKYRTSMSASNRLNIERLENEVRQATIEKGKLTAKHKTQVLKLEKTEYYADKIANDPRLDKAAKELSELTQLMESIYCDEAVFESQHEDMETYFSSGSKEDLNENIQILDKVRSNQTSMIEDFDLVSTFNADELIESCKEGSMSGKYKQPIDIQDIIAKVKSTIEESTSTKIPIKKDDNSDDDDKPSDIAPLTLAD